MNVGRRTINWEIPSAPTVYGTPQLGIHDASRMNWKPPAGASVHHKGTEIANSTRLAASATCLAQRAGATITTRAASAGHASSAVRTHCRYMGYRPAAPTTARTTHTI